MMKWSKYLLPVVFGMVLVVPEVNSYFQIIEFDRLDENRELNQSPETDLRHLDVYPYEFDAYYRDCFTFKAPFVEAFQQFKLDVLKISPSPKKSMLGNDGWVFLVEKEAEILAGKKDFSPECLDAFSSEWRHRKAFLDSLGIITYWYILPMKHYVYGDKLQVFTEVSNRPKRISQLQNHLNHEFPGLVKDPTELLIKARDSVKVYRKLDNHWNYNAGYSVAKDIIETLKQHFPQLELRPFESFNWQKEWLAGGYHANTTGINDSLLQFVTNDTNQTAKRFSYGFTPTAGFSYPGEYEYSYKKEDTTGLRILIVRDSFGDHLMPFLKESFSESVFIFDSWHYDLDEEIILKVKPDIVLYCSLETHAAHVIRSWSGYNRDM